MTDDRTTNAWDRDDSSRQFMSLASDQSVRFWTIRCLAHSAFVASLILLGTLILIRRFDWVLFVFPVIALVVGIAQVIVARTTNWLFSHPTFRIRPLLTVTGKLVEFDIPQLFVPRSRARCGLHLGSREQRRVYVTIVSACRWELSRESRKLFVTTRLPIWGLVKMRIRTEWDVPDFAIPQWEDFVLKVNQAEQP